MSSGPARRSAKEPVRITTATIEVTPLGEVKALASSLPPPVEAATEPGRLLPVPGDAKTPIPLGRRGGTRRKTTSPPAPLMLARPSRSSHASAVLSALEAHGALTNRYLADTAQPAGLDLDALRRASFFTVRLDTPGADDALLAAGVALAARVPSAYLVPDRKHLPWFLREADQTFPGRVRVVEAADTAALAAQISERGLPHPTRVEASAVPPLPGESPASIDTFIGCLMSGLSESQYAEGRAHLLRIDQVLRDRFGSEHNHCEGILVSSTASFGTPKESLAMDIAAIERAERCVFYAYDGQPRPSGMWVEAGVAIGLGKPSVFLVPSLDALPPALREEPRPPHVRVEVYGDHASLMAKLDGTADSLAI